MGRAIHRTLSFGILVKGIFEVWGVESSYEELRLAIENYPEDRKTPYLSADSTFKVIVDCFGKGLSLKEQTERINSLDYIPFQGRVNLKSPQHRFWLIESDNDIANKLLLPAMQKLIFFAREIGLSDRSILTKFELSRRNYLGPTAMDAEIAFIMANQGLVRRGTFVYDPFVGTGSILVAASHFGAITMGEDIDLRVVRDGRGPDCNVWSNFKQYDLPLPIGLIRADNNSPPWRSSLKEIFHAIICDPPYGVRAGGRKSGGRKLLKGTKDPYIIPEEKRKDHIPSTAPYMFAECVHDLLDIAARLLVMNGRLVFFYPVARGECYEDLYPKHECFTLIASSEQILSTRWSRCLLTMEKTAEYTDKHAALALQKHIEFRERHSELLDEREESLHSLVFAPSKIDNGLNDKDALPKYRGKHV
ncbi:hypothetical protein KP509_31G020800 [Ceratopteris richardii]|uniref:tRNA (guanine(10)-N(2))-methyltransferase n=1 Tax=Ceratopteris richardii TaxID=49495 RepID=A0A8T2QY10_CERRI|nr:hypothetical protein KP509_31G020800 [Ceratopteris richardii]